MAHSEKKSKGRPKLDEATIELKRAKILEAAKYLFKKDGFEAVSMRKIADRADMGAMTIYQYYPKKIDILRHIWAEFYIEIFINIDKAIANKRSSKQRLRAAVHAYLDYWFEHPDRFKMVYLNEDPADDHADSFVHQDEAVFKEYDRLFIQPVMEIFPENSERKNALIAQSVLCMAHGIALNLITVKEFGWDHYTKVLDTFFDTLLS